MTAGCFHVGQVGHSKIESGVIDSLLGRAFPCAAGCLASKYQQQPFHLLWQPKVPLKCPNHFFFGGRTGHIEIHRPPWTSPWFGWRIEDWRRARTGIKSHRGFLVDGGWHPVSCLPGQCLPIGLTLTCKVGCRAGPPPMPLQSGLWRDRFAQWMSRP